MSWTERLRSKEAATAAVAVLLLYVIGTIVHRLYLSPIAKFPGPKLAAATLWYEFYYDVVQPGQFTFQIRKLHKKYGPIVRINPYELHIDDPDFYDELYGGPLKGRDKWEWFYKLFGTNTSMFGTVPHEHHRLRRAALNPYFSKQSVVRLAPLIQSRIDALCERLRAAQAPGQSVNLTVAYSALTGDVITYYSFGKSYGFLKKPDFASEFHAILLKSGFLGHLLKQFGWLFPLMNATPEWLLAVLNPEAMPVVQLRNNISSQIQLILDGQADDSKRTGDHPTIFHEMLDSSLPPAEKSFTRLVDEGVTLVAAGSYTTAHVLTTTSFHLLANPEVLNNLRMELKSVMPSPDSSPSLQQLERLPYLSAVVSEGLRIANPVSSRLPRVSPDSPIIFREWVIPPGTPVSMTPGMLLENSAIFPEPREFRPERWLKEGSNERLDRYLVSFGKGTRSCLGMNLAHVELRLALAAVFHKFDLELYETTREDVDVAHDSFSASPKLGSKGVRVLVKERR